MGGCSGAILLCHAQRQADRKETRLVKFGSGGGWFWRRAAKKRLAFLYAVVLQSSAGVTTISDGFCQYWRARKRANQRIQKWPAEKRFGYSDSGQAKNGDSLACAFQHVRLETFFTVLELLGVALLGVTRVCNSCCRIAWGN